MILAYKDDALRRLKIIAGHLNSIRRMIDDERYCVDIMKPLAAVQASLEQVQPVLLKNHLSPCVTDANQAGSGEPAIEELVTALKYSQGVMATDGTAPRWDRDPNITGGEGIGH